LDVYILRKNQNLNNTKTNYKYDPEFQMALFDFMGTVDNVYESLDLKLSDREKAKLQEIRNRNAK
jgi:hypothetical protein